MMSIMSAYNNWKERKALKKARKALAKKGQVARGDGSESPSVIHLAPEAAKRMCKFEGNKRGAEPSMVEEKHMQRRENMTSSSYDDEKEYDANPFRMSKPKGRPRGLRNTSAVATKQNKFANLFTLEAQGRDFKNCTFDLDEASGLLYISSFGPMEKWNHRLQTGSKSLWVGDRLLSANHCVVRSLGALKELLLTHDDSFIEFMFMKYDQSAPAMPYVRQDKWTASSKDLSAKTLDPSKTKEKLVFRPSGNTKDMSVDWFQGERPYEINTLPTEVPEPHQDEAFGFARPPRARHDSESSTSSCSIGGRSYEGLPRPVLSPLSPGNLSDSEAIRQRKAYKKPSESEPIEGVRRSSFPRQQSPAIGQPGQRFNRQRKPIEIWGVDEQSATATGQPGARLYFHHRKPLHTIRKENNEVSVAVHTGTSRRPKTERIRIRPSAADVVNLTEESIFGDRRSALGTLRYQLFL